MPTTSSTSGTPDYTAELTALEASQAAIDADLQAINSSIQGLPNYTSELTRIAVALESIVTLLGTSNGIQNTINSSIAGMKSDIDTLTTAMTDSHHGVYVNSVDMPYQGLYQRALLRMGINNSNNMDNLKRAIGEEKISPLFNV